MTAFERWQKATLIAPTYKGVFNEPPWGDNWSYYSAWKQVTQDLKNPGVVLRLFKATPLLVGAFAWGYPKPVGRIVELKYQKAQNLVTDTLGEIGILPSMKGFYVSEVGTLPKYRCRGLATGSLESFKELARTEGLPLILRTLKQSEMAGLCRRIGLTELMINDLDDTRRTLFIGR